MDVLVKRDTPSRGGVKTQKEKTPTNQKKKKKKKAKGKGTKTTGFGVVPWKEGFKNQTLVIRSVTLFLRLRHSLGKSALGFFC